MSTPTRAKTSRKPAETPAEEAPAAEPSTALAKSAPSEVATTPAASPAPSAAESPEERELRLITHQVEIARGKVEYSHKTRAKSGDRQVWRNDFFLTVRVGGALITMIAAWLAILGVMPVATRLAAGVVSFLSFWSSLWKPDTKSLAQKHTGAAKLWLLMEQYDSLRVQLKAGTIRLEEARRRRDDLQNRTAAVYIKYPLNDERAYAMAEKDIKAGKTNFTRKELDEMFGPAPREDAGR